MLWRLLPLLIVFSSGCTKLGPNCVPSPNCVNDRWQAEESQELGCCSSDHELWWEDFEDPVLTQLIHCALESNLALQAAAVRIYGAKAELGIARGYIWPQIQRVFGYAVKGELSENIPPVSSLPDNLKALADTSNSLISASFDIAWELDFWGRYSSGIDAATADYCRSIAAYDSMQILLLAQVAEAYISLRLFQELLDIRQFNVEVQQRSLSIAEIRFQNGVTTELDVQQARAQLLNTQAIIPDLQKGISHAVNGLCELLGVPPGTLIDMLGDHKTVPSGPDCVAIGFPADMLRRRPDVRQAELSAIAEGARIGIAKADLLPSLGLAGTVGFSATTFSKWLDPKSLLWTAGPVVKWDILNYGRLRNAVRVQDAVYQAALLNYQESVIRAQKEVEDGVTAFVKSKQQTDLMTQVVVAANRALKVALTQYREGEADFTRVLRAQDEVLQAQTLEAETRSAVAGSLVQVYKALGGGQCRISDHVLWPETREQMCERTSWGCILDEEVE